MIYLYHRVRITKVGRYHGKPYTLTQLLHHLSPDFLSYPHNHNHNDNHTPNDNDNGNYKSYIYSSSLTNRRLKASSFKRARIPGVTNVLPLCSIPGPIARFLASQALKSAVAFSSSVVLPCAL